MRLEGMQEPAREPHTTARAGHNTGKRSRKETPLANLFNIMKDAEAARERRHNEKMALLRELVAAVQPNKG